MSVLEDGKIPMSYSEPHSISLYSCGSTAAVSPRGLHFAPKILTGRLYTSRLILIPTLGLSDHVSAGLELRCFVFVLLSVLLEAIALRLPVTKQIIVVPPVAFSSHVVLTS